MTTPFYNPRLTYEENYKKGPFGKFKDTKKYKEKNKPENELFGVPLNLPFGIPAGPLLNSKYIKAAFDLGFDIAVYKTVRTQVRITNPWPNIVAVHPKGKNLTLKEAAKGVLGDTNYKEPIAITNSFGVPSFDPQIWQKDMEKAVKYAKKGQVVVGSFQGTTNKEGSIEKYINDFAKAAAMVKKTKAPILEANLSCPNEGSSHLLCFDIKRTQQIAYAVKEKIGNTPLILKVAYFEDEAEFEKLIKAIGKIADGIAAINTIPAKILDKKGNQALPGENRMISGVCGYPIMWAGLKSVKRLTRLREKLKMDYKIIGVGGVTKPQDYLTYKKAGADAVMSATGAMWNPLLAQQIKKII